METSVTDGVTVVACQGRILFGEEATALREQIKSLLKSTRQIVLNLAGVSYIDSGGLGTLVGAYSSARSAGADIKLTGLGQRLRDVLQVTNWSPSSRSTTASSRRWRRSVGKTLKPAPGSN